MYLQIFSNIQIFFPGLTGQIKSSSFFPPKFLPQKSDDHVWNQLKK